MTNYNESAPEFTKHLPFHFLTNARKAMWVTKASHIASCLKFSFFSLLYPSPYMVKKKLISNIIHGSQMPVRAQTSARHFHSVPLLCMMHSALPMLWTAHSSPVSTSLPTSLPPCLGSLLCLECSSSLCYVAMQKPKTLALDRPRSQLCLFHLLVVWP